MVEELLNLDQTIEKIIKEHEKKYQYASPIKKIDYMYSLDAINPQKIIMLWKQVNRCKAIATINSIINNIDDAIKLEAGLFESTIIFSNEKKAEDTLLPSIYNDKLYNIVSNLKNNPLIVDRLNNKKLVPQIVPFLSHQELNPENVEKIISKNKLRIEKQKNMATTDRYECPKCHERRHSVYQMQTRSADEPMTTFAECLNCGKLLKNPSPAK